MFNQLLVSAVALLALIAVVASLVTLAIGSVRRTAPAVPVVTLDPKHWAAWLKPGDLLCSDLREETTAAWLTIYAGSDEASSDTYADLRGGAR